MGFLNWVDLLAIAPFYLSLVGIKGDLRFLRVIRLARLLKHLPSAKHGSLSGVVVDIVNESAGALFIPLYFMVLALIVFSSIMYYIEQTDSLKCHLGDGSVVLDWDTSNTTAGNEGCDMEYGCECSGTLTYLTYDGQEWTGEMYSSIPDSFWWCIVTFTTVGYGDRYPRTAAGRVVCTVTMFCGIFFLAMPLTIVGSSFAEAWDKLQAKRLKSNTRVNRLNGSWTIDQDQITRVKLECDAHMRRTVELFENMQAEANKGGTELTNKWDDAIGSLQNTQIYFEQLMEIYQEDVGTLVTTKNLDGSHSVEETKDAHKDAHNSHFHHDHRLAQHKTRPPTDGGKTSTGLFNPKV